MRTFRYFRAIPEPETMALKHRISLRIAIAAIPLLLSSLCSAQEAPYRAALKDYLEASNAMGSFGTAIDQMIGMQREEHSDLPPEFWDSLGKEMRLSIDDLVDMLAPVYERHLSIEDLQAVTTFYRSPSGSKFAEASPVVMPESMAVGADWGSKLGERIMKRIQEEGR